MIAKDGHEITAVTALGHEITAVYAGSRLVWENVSSCYGSGAWIGTQPWRGDDGWR